MSHIPNVFSAPGTPLLDRTVGELVAERPGRSRVFQAFQIDFCCQGGRTLREACERKELATQTVVAELDAEAASKSAPQHNPAELPPIELANYIVETHHNFLRNELPRLHAMSRRVAQVHGGHTPSLLALYDVFQALQQELDSHIATEEQVVFPAVAALSRGERPADGLETSLGSMLEEHNEAGAALLRLRELSNDFVAPPEACNTYRALFAGLHDLENDLHHHIHLENAVLFPAARALQAQYN